MLRFDDGSHLRTIGCKGASDGQFDHPADIALDRASHLIVVDTNNHRVQVFRYIDGSHVRSISSRGNNPHQLWYRSGVAIDTNGNIVVHDGCYNGRVKVFHLNDGSLIKSMCQKAAVTENTQDHVLWTSTMNAIS